MRAGTAFILLSAAADLADRWFQHVRVEQEGEGQSAATLMLPVEGRPVAALGLRGSVGGHA